jgi:acyl dehydratase
VAKEVLHPGRRTTSLGAGGPVRSVSRTVFVMATTVQGIEKFHDLVGQHLGYSDWHRIGQDQINLFAEATGDHQWIHVDPERAKSGPFGTAIAHGYLTLSLAPVLLGEVLVVEGTSMGVNYGCNKVRFPAPVPVDSNLRLGVSVAGAEDVTGGVQVALDLTFETEGSSKPSCVAQVVYRYFR